MDNFQAGDLIQSGSIVWEDTPDYTVTLIRDGDKIIVKTDYKNIQAMLDANAQEAADFNQTGKHSDVVKVAGIPIGLYFDWKREGITDDPEAMKRRLNDADYAKFRVNNWRL